jgi:Protein of unknown function (DUF3176)
MSRSQDQSERSPLSPKVSNFPLKLSKKQADDTNLFHASFLRRYSPTHTLSEKSLNSDRSSVSTKDSSKPRTWHGRLSRLIVSWWLWEIASWVLSAICICAIVLLLGVYNNCRLPTHWPIGITLNAEIAILAAVFKYTLAVPVDEAMGQLKWIWFRGESPRRLVDFERFDEASRGPWGSFCLVWHTKARYGMTFGRLQQVTR